METWTLMVLSSVVNRLKAAEPMGENGRCSVFSSPMQHAAEIAHGDYRQRSAGQTGGMLGSRPDLPLRRDNDGGANTACRADFEPPGDQVLAASESSWPCGLTPVRGSMRCGYGVEQSRPSVQAREGPEAFA